MRVSRDRRIPLSWLGTCGVGLLFCLMYAIKHGLPVPSANERITITLTRAAASILLHAISVTPFDGPVSNTEHTPPPVRDNAQTPLRRLGSVYPWPFRTRRTKRSEHERSGRGAVADPRSRLHKDMPMPDMTPLDKHHTPNDLSDRVALAVTRTLRFFADAFFARRYGHRAVVLETVAAVPGMVGGALQHLRSLRRLESDRGWIRTLLEEAENERMHLMTFMHIAQPSAFERMLILLAQGIFYNCFFLLYLVSPRTAHRVTGYFEEEAVRSYTEYLAGVDSGTYENVPAPLIAIDYWKLSPGARLRDVIVAVRADEALHRDVNHGFADELA